MTYCKVFHVVDFHFAYALSLNHVILLQSVRFRISVSEHNSFYGLQKKSAKPITASRNMNQITDCFCQPLLHFSIRSSASSVFS